MDSLEGHPRFYRRETITMASGQPAEIYIYQRQDSLTSTHTIPSGDWNQRATRP
jgi:gamma-glutamylcyclotransferase (GGCT)/AIG2-like uncharacterized protein YtfP